MCDRWWENETAWHRSWKGHFPVAWQEVVHPAEDGEVHIADVKTDQGWVLEFQHSHLNPVERRSREEFYPKLIWVPDGLRRKRDKEQLLRAYNDGVPLSRNALLRLVFPQDCRVLEEWADSSALVFFDLGESGILWCLMTRSTRGSKYLLPVPREGFISWLRSPSTEAGRSFEALGTAILTEIRTYESPPRAQQLAVPLPRPQTFRRRFRF